MSTVLSDPAAGATDSSSDRLGPGGPKPGSRARPRASRVASRGAGILAVGGVLWWLGHPLAAGIVVAIAVVLSVASVCSARLAGLVDVVVGTVALVAGRALTFVLLGMVQLLVIVPVWAVARITRRDPLAFGWSAAEPSLWRPGPRNPRRLQRRQFTDERAVRAQRRALNARLPLPRVRALIGLVVVLVVIDLAIGAGVDAFQRATDDAQPAPVVLPLPDSPTRSGEPWVRELNHELSTDLLDLKYDPFLGWRMPDYHGKYVNIADGVRRSYEPTRAGGQRIRIYFFGGSTMWGMFQRDDHTIPSQVARLAEADGISVEVVNYGAGVYVNWQELLLFEQLLARGPRPDLAVFYDGVNDLMSQFRVGPHTDPSHIEARAVEQTIAAGKAAQRGEKESLLDRITRSWSNTSAVNRVARAVRRLVSQGTVQAPPGLPAFSFGNEAQHADAAGADAATVYQHGVDVADRLGASYGVRTAFFWQPFLFSKQPGPGDKEATGRWGENPAAWRTANDNARTRLRAPVVDLSHALDVPDAVMYDYIHTNERGADAVARAMYDQLRPALLELAQRRPA